MKPLALNSFLQSIPEKTRGCKGRGDSAGTRVSVLPPNGNSYDLTQCDFHDGGVTALYVNSEAKVYMIHGQVWNSAFSLSLSLYL